MAPKGLISAVLITALIGAVYSKKCAKCELAVNTVGDVGMTIDGDVTFEQENENSNITIKVMASGFNETSSSSQHGFHVHELRDLTSGCNSLGSHYNPNNYNHSMPNNTARHVGDLGNIEISTSGSIDVTMMDFIVSLYGSQTVIGRSIVIHSGEDDLGLGGDAESLSTGNAGSRWACCIIEEENCNSALGLHSNVLLGCLLSLTILIANVM